MHYTFHWLHCARNYFVHNVEILSGMRCVFMIIALYSFHLNFAEFYDHNSIWYPYESIIVFRCAPHVSDYVPSYSLSFCVIVSLESDLMILFFNWHSRFSIHSELYFLSREHIEIQSNSKSLHFKISLAFFVLAPKPLEVL